MQGTCIVSGMLTLSGWWGMEWWVKVIYIYIYIYIVQMVFGHKSEAQRPAWKVCASSLMAKMKQNLHCECLDC